MAEMKRYDICAVIDENRNGEYVLYSDHLAAQVDAERYRWLRMAALADEDELIERLAAINSHPKTEAEFDAAIDQARGTDHD